MAQDRKGKELHRRGTNVVRSPVSKESLDQAEAWALLGTLTLTSYGVTCNTRILSRRG